MLTETVAAGLNNPECAFFVGSFIGGYMAIVWLLYMLAAFALFKLIDKLALEPLLNWLKVKIWRRKD